MGRCSCRSACPSGRRSPASESHIGSSGTVTRCDESWCDTRAYSTDSASALPTSQTTTSPSDGGHARREDVVGRPHSLALIPSKSVIESPSRSVTTLTGGPRRGAAGRHAHRRAALRPVAGARNAPTAFVGSSPASLRSPGTDRPVVAGRERMNELGRSGCRAGVDRNQPSPVDGVTSPGRLGLGSRDTSLILPHRTSSIRRGRHVSTHLLDRDAEVFPYGFVASKRSQECPHLPTLVVSG